VPFDRARELLDGLLDWRALKPWSFRKGLGYLLRSQDDFRDVFHLRKLRLRMRTGSLSWPTSWALTLRSWRSTTRRKSSYAVKQATAQTIKNELGGSIEDISKIEGILLLKQKEAEKKQKLLDAFDFRAQDKDQHQASWSMI
jgi:uncharacterized protein YydD (DUF2326 family)